MMVQKRQFRKTHIDEHYCAAIFHYMREYALLFKSQSLFICLDDKHRLKVGEPNFPVAAAENWAHYRRFFKLVIMTLLALA